MTSTSLHYEPLTVVSERIRRREVSPVEVTGAMLDRIGELDSRYHSYATVLADRAMDRAKTAEAEIAKGIWRGPLHGVPLALKDLCYTTFSPSAGGTTMHRSSRLPTTRRWSTGWNRPEPSRSASSR